MAAIGRILVTGANGHLGRRLIARLADDEGSEIRAVVRSERAAGQVRETPGGDRVEVRIIDYTDAAAMAEAARDCRAAVHLVGIIKETRAASYESAHEATCRVLADVASQSGLERIVYLSIFGSRPEASNACLASKGRAEAILAAGPVPALVLRVPMVLGEGDVASRSLAGQARAPSLFLPGGGRTLQQPIDADDVLAAVVAGLQAEPALDQALDLGGPECLSQRALVERVAALFGTRPRVVPLPLGLVRAGIGLLERLSGEPPITRAMFDVLQHDDRVDTEPACKRLGIALTPLDETLRRCVGPEAES